MLFDAGHGLRVEIDDGRATDVPPSRQVAQVLLLATALGPKRGRNQSVSFGLVPHGLHTIPSRIRPSATSPVIDGSSFLFFSFFFGDENSTLCRNGQLDVLQEEKCQRNNNKTDR